MSYQSFRVSFSKKLCKKPQDGRILLMISKDADAEPRFQIECCNYPDTQLIFGVDVEGLKPGETIVFDNKVLGYPLLRISDIPPGEYWIQALLHRYETFYRSDGHILKLPMDRGEGQKWSLSPGNFYSTPKKAKINPKKNGIMNIILNQVIPPFPDPEDTKYIKHITVQSKLLSEFWGRPMYLGAIIILPEGFNKHPEAHYPLMIWHGHYSQHLYVGFREMPPDPNLAPEPADCGNLYKHLKDFVGPDVPKDKKFYEEYNRLEQQYAYKLYKDWTAANFPRMIFVQIQHPTPYYDDSYAVNSANMGPYGDAITYELIPYIEKKFRGIGEGWARIMFGCSTGGWEVLAAQIFYPDEYNGCWSFSPDPIDFRAFQLINIYEDKNAYYLDSEWKLHTPRPSFRSTAGEILCTIENANHKELVLGTKGRSGDQRDAWLALFGPVGEDGYPKHLWDKYTGKIDTSVAEYMRENWDLRHILEKNWKRLGTKLKGKIHIYCGDVDNYYLNNAVYLMEEFLKNTKNPHYGGHIEYGNNFGHCWYGNHDKPSYLDRFTLIQKLAPEMMSHIIKTAPPNADLSWRY